MALATTKACSRRSQRLRRRYLGVLAGHWLLVDRSGWIKGLGLAVAGLACLGLGTLWGQVFPIIKILWTSSYVLVAGGWSLLLLAIFYTVIDVIKFRAWAFFFVVIGVNAITIYIAAASFPLTRSLNACSAASLGLGIVWACGRVIGGSGT